VQERVRAMACVWWIRPG